MPVLFISYVILGNLFHIFVPHFLMQNIENMVTYP